MSDRLPLFPLGTVLFPGLVLPLHVFEQRYRDAGATCWRSPRPDRQFGVVAIREGREVGADGVPRCTRSAAPPRCGSSQEHPDGTSTW